SSEEQGWNELWRKEDWWAVWLGLGIVIVGIIAFLAGGTITPIAVKRAAWDILAALSDHFAAQWQWYVAQLLLWLIVFGTSASAMGWKLGEFLPSFLVLYSVSV